MSKTWSDVEKEYAALLKNEIRIAKQKALLDWFHGNAINNMKIMDNYVESDTVHKNINKQWRMMKVMSELEKNSFVKMWTDGWCAGCEFDSSKCAEQHECQAYKTLKQQWSDDDNGGGDSNEETI